MSIVDNIVSKLENSFGSALPAEFVFADRAKKDLKKIAKKNRNIAGEVIEFCKKVRADSGDQIKRSGGARKVRMEGSGKGSSGAYRVIVYSLIEGQLHIIHIYAKNEKEELSESDLKMIREYIGSIKNAGMKESR